MTVKELIKLLQQQDPEKEVMVSQEECGSGVIDEVYSTDWHSDGEVTPVVIIEANL